MSNIIEDDLQEPLLSQDVLLVEDHAGDRVGTVTLQVHSEAEGRGTEETEAEVKDIVFRTGCRCGIFSIPNKEFRLNHNVFLNLLLCILYGASDSLWGGTVIAAYIKIVGHNRNEVVGNVEAAQGVANLISALPVGYLADKIGRDKVLRAGAILIMVTIILHLSAMQWIGVNEEYIYQMEGSTSYWLLGLIMAMWGITGGIVNGPAQALYADSVPEGQRSAYYVYLFSCSTVSSCVGPLVSIILFETLGDKWDLYDLRIMIYVGLGIEVGNVFIMLLFDDKKALEGRHQRGGREAGLGQQEQQLLQQQQEQDMQQQQQGQEEHQQEQELQQTQEYVNNHHLCEKYENSARQQCVTSPNTTLSPRTDSLAADTLTNEPRARQPLENILVDDLVNDSSLSTALPQDTYPSYHNYRWMIPYLIFAQSLVFSLGSGMTVKFFPLFFKEEIGMTPTQVQIIYVLVPIFMVLGSIYIKKLASSGLGRTQSMVLANSIGIGLLYCMVFFKSYLDRHPVALVPIYVLRTVLLNCTYPLEESILMDFVNSKERARWKSLDSVAVFGWCGSASLGGYISDKYDYSFTFLITASVQSIGLLLLCCLIPLVPRKEGRTSNE